MPVNEPRSRVVHTSRPVPLGAVVSVFRRGGGDPTSRREHDAWWFGWLTPAGAVHSVRARLPLVSPADA